MTIKFRAKHKSGFVVDSPLTPFTFPGGEAHIKVPETFVPEDYTHHTAIITGHDPQDLFLASMYSQLLLEESEHEVHFALILPYLPAARADRGFPNLATYTSFVTELITPNQLITLDPHSPVWVESAKLMDPYLEVTEFPVARILKDHVQNGNHDTRPDTYVGVIAPDKGAHDRAAAAAKVMGVPVYQAGKKRDEATGKLSGFHMEDELPAEGKLLIVDDICDGGGTFLGLADATGLPKDRVDLWVTHGIFSKGLSDLRQHFGRIHTTDSYLEINEETGRFRVGKNYFNFDPDFVKVHPIIATLEAEVSK